MPPQPKRYSKLHKIGEGAYGTVYRAHDSVTGNLVALKKIIVENDDDGVPSTAIREISILKHLQHPNIVQLHEVCWQASKLTLVFEFLDKDLRGYMKHSRTRNMDTVKSFLHQMLSGIAHCHKHRVLHRDLKPHNILVNPDGVLKLADFGLARAFGFPSAVKTHEVITLWYRPPEILMFEERYDTAVDMWSIGCIFAELCTGQPLFMGESEFEQLIKIFQVTGTPTEATWPGVSTLRDYKVTFPQWKRVPMASVIPNLDPAGLDLLDQMLQCDPRQRITAADALGHPYFNGFALQ